jgi:hypothetical protein
MQSPQSARNALFVSASGRNKNCRCVQRRVNQDLGQRSREVISQPWRAVCPEYGRTRSTSRRTTAPAALVDPQ